MRKERDYLYNLNGLYKVLAENKFSQGFGEGKRIEQHL